MRKDKKIDLTFFNWFNQSDFLLIVYHNLAGKWGANWKTGLLHHRPPSWYRGTSAGSLECAGDPWWGAFLGQVDEATYLHKARYVQLVRSPSLRRVYIYIWYIYIYSIYSLYYDTYSYRLFISLVVGMLPDRSSSNVRRSICHRVQPTSFAWWARGWGLHTSHAQRPSWGWANFNMPWPQQIEVDLSLRSPVWLRKSGCFGSWMPRGFIMPGSRLQQDFRLKCPLRWSLIAPKP